MEAADLRAECEISIDMSRRLIRENASIAVNQEEYAHRFDALTRRYEASRVRLSEIEEQRQERTAKRVQLERYMQSLTECGDLVTEFDDELWYTTVDKGFVFGDGRVAFRFKDGVSALANQ